MGFSLLCGQLDYMCGMVCGPVVGARAPPDYMSHGGYVGGCGRLNRLALFLKTPKSKISKNALRI